MTNIDDTVQLAGTAVCCLSENLLTATLDAESKTFDEGVEVLQFI